MVKVGIRELKSRLSHYVRQAEAGEVVVVTDRGRVVAEMWPPSEHDRREDAHPGLAELERRGLLRRSSVENSPAYYPAMPPLGRSDGPSAQDLIDWERGDR